MKKSAHNKPQLYAENKVLHRDTKRTKPEPEKNDLFRQALEKELHHLQQRMCIGYEVTAKWLPGTIKHHNGKQLAEEVIGNTILIYVENPQKAIELVRHGFLEWMLNQDTRPYRQLINKLVTLFEELQYERKEGIIRALEKLL